MSRELAVGTLRGNSVHGRVQIQTQYIAKRKDLLENKDKDPSKLGDSSPGAGSGPSNGSFPWAEQSLQLMKLDFRHIFYFSSLYGSVCCNFIAGEKGVNYLYFECIDLWSKRRE